MNKFSKLRYLLIHIAYMRILLLSLLVAFCLLATLFIGAILMLEYQWRALSAVTLCLMPWFLAIIVSWVILLRSRASYEREKAELAEYSRAAIFNKIAAFVLSFLLNKKKK
jgi:hypothetical protein